MTINSESSWQHFDQKKIAGVKVFLRHLYQAMKHEHVIVQCALCKLNLTLASNLIL